MSIENRFALVTLRIPFEDFIKESEINVWPPGDWPQVVAEASKLHMESEGYEVAEAQMEGEVYREKTFLFYCVWSIMGSLISQYIPFKNDPPSIKEIQDNAGELAQAAYQAMKAAGEAIEKPPSDVLLFFFNRVSGKIEDAVPDDEIEPTGQTPPGNEVEGIPENNYVPKRKRGGSKLH